VADDERPLIRVNALSFFQCFDTAGWVTGRTSMKPVATCLQRFCCRTYEKKRTEEVAANPGSPGLIDRVEVLHQKTKINKLDIKYRVLLACTCRDAQLSYTTQHRTVLMIFPLIIHTVIIAHMMSAGRVGGIFTWKMGPVRAPGP